MMGFRGLTGFKGFMGCTVRGSLGFWGLGSVAAAAWAGPGQLGEGGPVPVTGPPGGV